MRNGAKIIMALLMLLGLATFMGLGSVVASKGPYPSQTPTPNERITPTELYKTNCAGCHKDSGKGGEAVVDGKKVDAEDLTSAGMKGRSDARLFADIAEGSPDDGMPSFRDKLTESQINKIIMYIRVDLQHIETNVNSK
ncbi:MAG TPA: c-type cytochrome [Pyrinomonadaceae bacterium]|jgi:mono/diheme cytochrome c family protein